MRFDPSWWLGRIVWMRGRASRTLSALVAALALLATVSAAALRPCRRGSPRRRSPAASARRPRWRSRRTAAVRRRAGRQPARDQERRAARDAVPDRHRRLRRRARPARRRLRSRLRDQPLRLRLLHGRRRRPIHNRVSRFTANGDVAVPGSEVVHPRPRPTSRARPTTTAARSTSAPTASSTSPSARTPTAPTRRRSTNLLGKILRINADGTIPTDNPFFNTADGRRTARSGRSACATRSPSRSSPAPARMFINDVGENTWEEIDDGHRRRRTTAGPTPRARRPTRASAARSSPTATAPADDRLRDHRRRVLQPDRPRSSRAATSATTSSPTSAAAGSARLDPANGNAVRRRSRPASAAPVDLAVATDGSLYYLARGARRRRLPRRLHRATRRRRITRSRRARRSARRVGDVHASPPPARRRSSYQWQRNGSRHCRRDRLELHDRVRTERGQRRPVPRARVERLRQREQRGHADRGWAGEPLLVVDANIQITPATATNPVARAHTLTGHVNVNPGTGTFANAPDGTLIRSHSQTRAERQPPSSARAAARHRGARAPAPCRSVRRRPG